MAAAIESARSGLSPIILDERPAALLPAGSLASSDSRRDGPSGPQAACDRERLLGELKSVSDRIRIVDEARVLAITREREVLWTRGRGSTLWSAGTIILAAGGEPRIVPFPGWTLPGVICAADLRDQDSLRARRALVVGTGPGLLVAAAALLERGVHIEAVVEAGQPPWSAPGAIPALGDRSAMLEDAKTAWESLNRAGVPVHVEHAVFKAHGQKAVTSATFGPLEPGDWRPRHEHARELDVDLVVTEFGAVSSHELAILAGCRHRYDRSTGCWLAQRDALMRTTVPGIFVTGDGAGVAAGLVAEEEGRIAGITAAEEAGAITPDEAAERRGPWQERLAERTRMRLLFDEASRIRPGLLDLLEPGTVVCPCESVSLAALRAAVADGARALSAVKLQTRLGMGRCQGRVCGPAAELFLTRETRRPHEEVGQVNPRPPIRPVTLGVLARMECPTLPDQYRPHATGEETR